MALSSERDPFNIPVPIREMSIFRGLDGEALFSITADMRERLFIRGETIVSEGTTGDHIYIVGTGAAEVVKRAGSHRELVLARFEPGQFFGEMSLIEDDIRSASVRACEDETTIFSLGRRHLDRMAAASPEHYHTIICNIALEIAKRLRGLQAAAAPLQRLAPVTAWPGWHGVYLFEGMAADAVRALAVAALDVVIKPGEVVFAAGAPADSLWILEEGSLEILSSAARLGQGGVSILGPGGVIGEMSVVEGGVRECTVRTREKSMAHCLTLPVLRKFATYWPVDNNRMTFNIARDLSRRLRSLDAYIATRVAQKK